MVREWGRPRLLRRHCADLARQRGGAYGSDLLMVSRHRRCVIVLFAPASEIWRHIRRPPSSGRDAITSSDLAILLKLIDCLFSLRHRCSMLLQLESNQQRRTRELCCWRSQNLVVYFSLKLKLMRIQFKIKLDFLLHPAIDMILQI